MNLEAHGRYISRLIEPEAAIGSTTQMDAQQSPLDIQPALQYAAAGPRYPAEAAGPHRGSSWDMGHSSGSQVHLLSTHSAVRQL